MPETNKIKLRKSDLAKFKMNDGFVLVKTRRSNEGVKTESGILLGFNVTTNYGEGYGSHVADLAIITGEVVMVCDKLIYDKNDQNDSMLWETEIEVQAGDVVWFDYLESLTCTELYVDDEHYRVMPYQSLWVAKRGEQVITLNGYCLVTPIKREKLSDFDIYDDIYDYTRGIVRYVGSKNKSYLHTDDSDDVPVGVGDTVVFSQRYARHPIYLERNEFISEFGETNLLRVQRRDFAIVIKDDSNSSHSS